MTGKTGIKACSSDTCAVYCFYICIRTSEVCKYICIHKACYVCIYTGMFAYSVHIICICLSICSQSSIGLEFTKVSRYNFSSFQEIPKGMYTIPSSKVYAGAP